MDGKGMEGYGLSANPRWGLGENKWSARTGRAERACFHAVIVIWLYGYNTIILKF